MLRIERIQIDDNLVSCGDINIILGANNSGKSTFIHDLQMSLGTLEIRPENKWVDGLSIRISDTKNTLEKEFPSLSSFTDFQDFTNEFNKLGLAAIYGGLNLQPQVMTDLDARENLEHCLLIRKDAKKNALYYYFNFFVNLMTQTENCDQRLTGPFDATINQITDPPKNIIHFLYRKREVFNEISKEINITFGDKIVFDNLAQGTKDLRLKPKRNLKPEDSKTPETLSKYWTENSPLVAFLGDGIKAYLKILYALYLPPKNLILIDEPETFLHPPQRRNLGRFIADNSTETKQIFIATHDSEFLRGILGGKERNVKIFHLKNGPQGHSCDVIDSHDIRGGASRNISEPMLNAFFHKITVVCEAEDDRMVYQYALEKLSKSAAIESNFIGCNGKAETLTHIAYLRSINLKCCCILDIDTLYSNEIITKATSLGISNKEIALFRVFQNTLKAYLGSLPKGREEFQKKGIKLLAKNIALKSETEKIISLLENFGIFVLSAGTLESLTKVPKTDSKKVQTMINYIEATKEPKIFSLLRKINKF